MKKIRTATARMYERISARVETEILYFLYYSSIFSNTLFIISVYLTNLFQNWVLTTMIIRLSTFAFDIK